MNKLLIIFLALLLPSAAQTWGPVMMSGGGCPQSSFVDTFQGISDLSAPSSCYWGSPYSYYGSDCSSSSYCNVQSGSLWFNSLVQTSGYCVEILPTALTLPVSTGRYFSITVHNWANLKNAPSSHKATIWLINSSNYAEFVSSGSTKNMLMAQVYYNSTGPMYYIQFFAYDSAGAGHSLATSYQLGAGDPSGSHTLKLYLNDTTHASVYWDTTLAHNNIAFNSYVDLGTSMYGLMWVQTGSTSSTLVINVTSASFQ